MGISGLDAALSGLRVAQKQLDVISNNVANVSTPGYTRKLLPQETSVLLGQSAGVSVNPVIRRVDLNVERDVWTQVSATEFLNVQASYLNSVQEFHGPPDKELSVAAEIARLRDSFVELSNQPDNDLLLNEALGGAVAVASKLNDFSTLLTQMRNDAQDQARISINKANALLGQIAELNKQIKGNISLGRTSAALEDQRDIAITSLSEEIEISFFTRGDGVLVVQTKQGQQLADQNATPLFFDPNPVGAESAYPATAAGLYIGGDPAEVSAAFDITQIDVGGKIGAYLDLRDTTLPKYQAQLDELAHKLALRMEAQGVRLFTDVNGNVPPDTAPIPNPPGPLTPVPYVGFAADIRVNESILNDPDLLRNSTLSGVTVQDGSSEFLRRIVEFGFGEYEYLEAQGNVDARVSALAPPLDTLQGSFGLNPQAQIVGNVDIESLSTGIPLNQAPGHPFLPVSGPPLLDDFTISINGSPAQTIDLTAVDAAYPVPPSASGAESLVSYLNNDVFATALGLTPAEATAQLNQFGQLVITSQYDIVLDASGVGGMGDDGLEFLGLTAGTTSSASPYFDVQVGKDDPVRVSVDPGDTEVTLLAKLNAVPGVVASIDALTGFLNIRPGPGFGGDLRLIDGPLFSTGGVSVVQELFGSSNPISGIDHPAFRQTNLGPGADLSTSIANSGTIIDFSQKMVSAQTEDVVVLEARQKDEQSYRELIERQFKDESGVNLDEELSQLIVIQTAYAASAKTITTLEEMFRRLLDAF
ncbi:MAG: flagellar hook-associated protein FlgK [Micavibrio sp.]